MDLIRLQEAMTLLENVLGQTWIKAEVHKIPGWSPEQATGIHPLVRLWYQAREELGLAELTGQLPDSAALRQMTTIADDLTRCSNCSGYAGLISALKDPALYQATRSLLDSAVQHLNQGQNVTFIPAAAGYGLSIS